MACYLTENSARLLVLLLVLGGTIYGGSFERPALAAVQDAQTHELTGCLQRSSDVGSFVLDIQGSGEQIAVVGPNELAKHVGHTVRLTGVMSENALKVSDVILISERCHS